MKMMEFNIAVLVIFMGLVGSCIGWITNVIAIKLLFRPYAKLRIPVLGWGFQGLIPKRKNDIAAALAGIVSTELITGDDVASSLRKDNIKEKIAQKIRDYVCEHITNRIPFVIPLAIQQNIADYAGKVLYQEVINFLDNPGKVLQESDFLEIKTEIYEIVEEKVLSFDMARLEELTYQLARTELKHIELLGAVLGFVIGIVQGIITVFAFSR